MQPDLCFLLGKLGASVHFGDSRRGGCPAEDIYAMNFRSLGSIAFCAYDVVARQDRKCFEMTSTFPKDLSEVTDEHTLDPVLMKTS
jgi:hypothetical protein